jgi:AraC-like DNA-binding protein
MPHWEWDAPRGLGRFVVSIAASTDAGAPLPVRVLPDGGADLLFTRTRGGDVHAEVFGPKRRALLVHDLEPTEKLAVRLRPGVAARWLGVPAHELADRAVPLESCWGRAARELASALAEADGREAQRALVEAALLARVSELPEPLAWLDAAVAAWLASGGRGSVGALARELGVGERRLERAFLEHVGLAPKRFARIVRLERARRALARGASQLEAALGAGYHDQAHLHRDFRALAGAAPSALSL